VDRRQYAAPARLIPGTGIVDLCKTAEEIQVVRHARAINPVPDSAPNAVAYSCPAGSFRSRAPLQRDFVRRQLQGLLQRRGCSGRPEDPKTLSACVGVHHEPEPSAHSQGLEVTRRALPMSVGAPTL